MSYMNLVAYILSFPTKILTRSLSLAKIFLFGRIDKTLKDWEVGDIGEINSLLYLTQAAGFNFTDIALYDIYLFSKKFGNKTLYTTPDFLIKGLTFYESKATGTGESTNTMLKLAYTDLQYARNMKFQEGMSNKFNEIITFVAGLNDWGGISAFDTKTKLLVVQWLKIIG
ncbi:MAG: hypothetical protein HeimC3_34350 [Candidatus Heimdallarchaeota archaeon LC_3]|nr:MAG: hypothetical protein HeimC3_34350 [Candidatus Heimdallarchaeota archaeon LC_3]